MAVRCRSQAPEPQVLCGVASTHPTGSLPPWVQCVSSCQGVGMESLGVCAGNVDTQTPPWTAALSGSSVTPKSAEPHLGLTPSPTRGLLSQQRSPAPRTRPPGILLGNGKKARSSTCPRGLTGLKGRSGDEAVTPGRNTIHCRGDGGHPGDPAPWQGVTPASKPLPAPAHQSLRATAEHSSTDHT